MNTEIYTALVLLGLLISGFVSGWLLRSEWEKEKSYRELEKHLRQEEGCNVPDDDWEDDLT